MSADDKPSPHWARIEDGEAALREITGAMIDLKATHDAAIDRAVQCIWLRMPGRADELYAISMLRQQLQVLNVIKERTEQMLAKLREESPGGG